MSTLGRKDAYTFVGVDLSPLEKYLGLVLRIGIGFIWIWMAVVPKLIFPERGTMMTKMASWPLFVHMKRPLPA